MIKIAISGPHGSGKTILINKMKDSFESFDKTVYVVEEIARKCPHPLETIKSQRWIWENQIKEEIKASKSNCDIILYDRTLLDNLLYYMDLLESNQFDPVFNSFWYYTINWMNFYKYISVLPMNPEFIVDDGFRITDMNKTIEIDKLFIKYLKPYMNIDINRHNYRKKIEEILNDKN
jgi:nicotinamide riboside kinase